MAAISDTLRENAQHGVRLARTHFVAVLLGLLVLHLLRNKFKRGLRSIPGPTLAAYTGLWRFFDVRAGDAHHTAIKLHAKYGPLVRIAPNVVSVADVAAIQTIYGLKTNFTKTAFYPIQCISWKKKPQLNLFSTRDPVYHRDQKKLVAGAYSLSSLLEMEDAVDSCSMLFMHKMGAYADSGAPVDLGMWMQLYAFDVVGELSFSTKLGFLETGGDVDGMIHNIEGMLLYASQCGQLPEWHPFLLGNPLFPILIPSMETWNAVLNFTLKAVNSRGHLERDGKLETNAIGRDMLSKWNQVMVENPGRITTRDIIVHLSTNVFAGSDTTAIALRAVVYFLLKNPAKMEKFMTELDGADARGLLSYPVSYREATTHLPYLQAVIKEAIRLHPSVGLLLERHVPAGGVELCGRYIPAGTIVGINAWVLHHDPSIFPQPDCFIPERWIDNPPATLALMNQAWFAFGAGSRTCIGKNISMMEMSKVLPQLFREYTVELADAKKEWKTRNVWFVQQEGVVVRLQRRK
ncbi:cytochrome P450 [Limtongia smithiae]|uniref:cytochrome P450 n=1 Tax=Limtongia smithiae TaxID=1125753 RepID=UPI0034CD6023